MIRRILYLLAVGLIMFGGASIAKAILFDTSFENRKTATETVTPMLEKDGKWRVSGYHIK